jgi:hypothetical protein
MKFTYFLLFALTILFSGSCVKNNPDPSWIYIDNWTLQANKTNTEGELTHNITDAYVLIDDKIIGYFQLPIKLPLLLEGTKKIAIYPAIHNNGISSTKKTYPFLEPYILTTSLSKNQTLTISPITRYYTQTNFWIENFEDAGIKLQTNPNFPPILTTNDDPSILKYGQRYGWIHLTKSDSIWMGTTTKLGLPQNGAEVYLEIDYMNTNRLLTGVNSYGSSIFKANPNIQLNAQQNATKKWKKIYIDLKEIISYSPNYNVFEQYFEAELDAGKDSTDIYIDNIKLVYFGN